MSHVFLNRLAPLAIGASLLPLPSTANAESLRDTGEMLNRLRSTVFEFASSMESRSAAQELARVEAMIDDAFRQLNQNGAGCDNPAIAYIAAESPGSPGIFAETVRIRVVGTYGQRFLEIAAGTTISDAVYAINADVAQIGMVAFIAPENPNRIAVRSGHWFVEVHQTFGAFPHLYASPLGGKAMFQWTDYECTTGEPACAEPGVLYLSTGYALETSMTLVIAGFHGDQAVSFVSGTTQASIIASIASFQWSLGIEALPCADNPLRLEFRSRQLGEMGYVALMEVGGPPPMIFTQPIGGTPTYMAFDQGRFRLLGDANCDRIVNVMDLLEVVQHWGACPLPPFECVMDVTNDGAVNVSDLLNVIQHWGTADP